MEQTERFINGNVLFFYGSMGSSSTLREMESDYGVIPYPKMDTAQENYISQIAIASCNSFQKGNKSK